MPRTIAGIALGALVALLLIGLIELIGHAAFPLPENVTLQDPEQPAGAADVPASALAIVVLAWFAGAFAGGWIARRIGGRWWAAWAVAALVVCGGVLNILLVPHPAWMQIAAIGAPLIGGLIAAHLPGPGTSGGKDE